jgi:hypothetical protein
MTTTQATTTTTTTDAILSKGHLELIGAYEYFQAHDGDVYCAPWNMPLDVVGYRQGARFFSTAPAAELGMRLQRALACQNEE